jgi:predicted RNase H-like nuclease
MLEVRFNSSTFAEILCIPMSKTLIRRHLSICFRQLIGNELQERKNHHQSLTTQTRIKQEKAVVSQRTRTRLMSQPLSQRRARSMKKLDSDLLSATDLDSYFALSHAIDRLNSR